MQLLSLALASYFAFTLMMAGLAKVDYPHHLARTLRATHLLPDKVIQPLVKIISWGEIVISFWFVSGIIVILAALVNLTLFAGFLGFKILVSRRKLLTDCGCFGETYRREVDSVSIVVSTIQVGLAILYLWLVLYTQPMADLLHLIIFMIFAAFVGFVYWRIAQRRKFRSQTN